jgi:hypothetical protein
LIVLGCALNGVVSVVSSADGRTCAGASVAAKQKLMDTMTKLGLDGQKISGKHLQTYSLDELMHEKKKVKNELKYYD